MNKKPIWKIIEVLSAQQKLGKSYDTTFTPPSTETKLKQLQKRSQMSAKCLQSTNWVVKIITHQDSTSISRITIKWIKKHHQTENQFWFNIWCLIEVNIWATNANHKSSFLRFVYRKCCIYLHNKQSISRTCLFMKWMCCSKTEWVENKFPVMINFKFNQIQLKWWFNWINKHFGTFSCL